MLGDQTGAFPSQQLSSRRDAATLTEDSRGLQKALHLAEVQSLCTKEDDEQSSIPPRHHDRLGKMVDQESEEDEYFREDLELMGDRNTQVEDINERRRFKKTDGRYLGYVFHLYV